MRIVFAGTPAFASTALEALLAAGYTVPLVLTQPDRPAGRGLHVLPSPVKQTAQAAGIPVAQPLSLRLDGRYPDEARQARSLLQAAAPDVMVVAAYGLILPLWVLELPIHGCINIHASLLPRWRGAAPIQRAIEAGDVRTGITIMQMDAGLDTGNILLTQEVPIGVNQTAGELHADLAAAGASAIVQALQALAAGTLSGVPQSTENVTYAAKLNKACAALDTSAAAEVLARQVRAFNPVPGATILLPGLDKPVKLWRSLALTQHHTATPGTVLRVTPAGIDVATGAGVLRLLELQKAGGKRQPVAAFVQGWHGG